MSSIDFKRLSELIKGYLANGDIVSKYRCVNIYQKALLSDVGDIINYCHEIIEANTELSFNDWCNDILVLSNDGNVYGIFGDYGGDVLNDGDKMISNPSYRAVWLIKQHIDKIIGYEIRETKGIPINKTPMVQVEGDIKDKSLFCHNGAKYIYWLTSSMYEYILCRKIYDYFNEHTPHNKTNCIKDYLLIGNYFGDYIKAIKAVFLYVALKNEMACIKQQAAIEGVELNGVENTPKKDLKGLISVPNSTDGTIIPQEAQKAVKSSLNGIVIPDVINTQEAQKYFKLAIEYKAMDVNYKWLKSKALLAQFGFEMSIKLELNKAQNSDGQRYACWKPFEQLFKVKNLRGTYNDFKKTGEYPKGIEIINKIFDL